MAVNQHKKDGNGPNAYKKGNRSGSKRATGAMVRASEAYSDKVEEWRAMAEGHRKACKYSQEYAATLLESVMAYVKECLASYDSGSGKYLKAITRAGLQLAAGVVNRDVFYRLSNGDYDYRLFAYIDSQNIDVDSIPEDENGIKWYADEENRRIPLIPFSDIVQKALLYAEAEAEQSMHINGRITELSRLNVVHGWREEKAPTSVNQTLVIASEEEANRMLELLK